MIISRLIPSLLAGGLLGLCCTWANTTLAQMPAGHPPAGHPGAGQMQSGRPQNSSRPDPSLPAGTIKVRVLGGDSKGVSGAQVELTKLFQSIDRGNSQDSTSQAIAPNGEAIFSDLSSGLRLSYQVRVTYQGAHYDMPAFRLTNVGQLITIYVYPTTSNVKEAFVGFRGLTYVQMREDFFHVSAMYRVLNMSDRTFVPRGITMRVPPGAQAIDVESKVGDAGFDKVDDTTVALVGSFPPGHKDLQFVFQLPNENKKDLFFEMGVPPHLAEQRILVEKVPGMDLSVPGFGTVETTMGPDGKAVMFVQKVMQPGQAQLSSIRIELSGLPTIGPGRWVAVALALGLSLGGIGFAFSRSSEKGDEDAQRKRARDVLLEEMKLLETARSRDQIGPRTYEQTRREILLSLARLEQSTAT